MGIMGSPVIMKHISVKSLMTADSMERKSKQPTACPCEKPTMPVRKPLFRRWTSDTSSNSITVADSHKSPDSDSESPLSSCPTEQPQHHRKSVSFASCEFRQYKVCVGDHPLCTMGFPLSLDWTYDEAGAIPVDQYEATRAPRRPRHELKTSCEERRKMLLEVGNAETDLRRAERKLHRARSCSAKLCGRMNETFFHDDNDNTSGINDNRDGDSSDSSSDP